MRRGSWNGASGSSQTMTDEKAWRDLVASCWPGRTPTSASRRPSRASRRNFAASALRRAPSPWEIVEHLRLAQFDILDFCVNAHYEEKKWPDDYWPASAAPPSRPPGTRGSRSTSRPADAAEARRQPEDQADGQDSSRSGQTYLRELVLVADHAAYHVGQLVLVPQQLGSGSQSAGEDQRHDDRRQEG